MTLFLSRYETSTDFSIYIVRDDMLVQDFNVIYFRETSLHTNYHVKVLSRSVCQCLTVCYSLSAPKKDQSELTPPWSRLLEENMAANTVFTCNICGSFTAKPSERVVRHIGKLTVFFHCFKFACRHITCQSVHIQ